METNNTDNSLTSTKFYGSKLNTLGQSTTEKRNKLFNTDEESINNNISNKTKLFSKIFLKIIKANLKLKLSEND